jgi:hypothetical protein
VPRVSCERLLVAVCWTQASDHVAFVAYNNGHISIVRLELYRRTFSFLCPAISTLQDFCRAAPSQRFGLHRTLAMDHLSRPTALQPIVRFGHPTREFCSRLGTLDPHLHAARAESPSPPVPDHKECITMYKHDDEEKKRPGFKYIFMHTCASGHDESKLASLLLTSTTCQRCYMYFQSWEFQNSRSRDKPEGRMIRMISEPLL